MRTRIAVAALAAFVSSACGRQPSTADTDQVYRAVLDSLYFDASYRAATVVARARTASHDFFGPLGLIASAVQGLPEDLVAGLVRANTTETTLTHFALVSRQQVFLDSAQEAAVFDQARRDPFDFAEWRRAWAEFKARYPGAPGIIELSRVGFNRSGNRALVRVMRKWGPLDASTDLVVLVRHSARWTIQEVRNLGVA